MDLEITERLSVRDRVMRRMFDAAPLDERVTRSDRLQREVQEIIASAPEFFDRFYRRNLARRAVPSNVQARWD